MACEPLNVALIGYGLAGRVFHAPLLQATPGLRLHSVVSSRDAEIRASHPQVRVCAQASDVLADPAIDLVVIATPNDTHAPLAQAALRAGKHVVVDKPFALDLDQARAVAAQARDCGKVLSVFHNRRWDADFLTLRRLLESGALGEVVELHSHFDRFRPQVPDRWRDREGPGAGLWYDLGPHLADQALQLFGPPLAVYADLGLQRDGATAVDYFHVQLRYARLRVLLHGGSLVPGHGLRFAVHGSAGSWIKHGLDPQEDALRAGQVPGEGGWGRDRQPGTLLRVGDGGTATDAGAPAVDGNWPAYYAGVREAIVHGTAPPVTADSALLAQAVLEAALESAAGGREVAFELPG